MSAREQLERGAGRRLTPPPREADLSTRSAARDSVVGGGLNFAGSAAVERGGGVAGVLVLVNTDMS